MKNLSLLLLGVLLLFSCKKDSDVTVEKTTLEYLTGISSKKWVVSEGIVLFEGAQVNLIANQPTCITDNILVLNTDKTYQLNEGALKCDPSKDPDVIIKSKWSLTEEPKTITIDKFIFLSYVLENSKFLITSIDENKFVGETEVTLQGKIYKANLTFSRVN
jgi:hypothetical protein